MKIEDYINKKVVSPNLKEMEAIKVNTITEMQKIWDQPVQNTSAIKFIPPPCVTDYFYYDQNKRSGT